MSRLGGLIVAAVAVLALPASAVALPATFGADMSQSVTLGPACASTTGQACSVVTLTKSTGATETGSPLNGVLTSARIRTAGGATTVAVRVLRPNPAPPTYLNVGPEVPIPVPADAGGSGGVISEATGLHHPIATGDRLGIGWTQPATPVNYGVFNPPMSSCAFRQQPTFTDGGHPVGTSSTYFDAGCSFEVLVQGTVEADADGDGFGDDTQDQCPTDASTHGTCPVAAPLPTSAPVTQSTKKKCKKKHKRSAQVAKKHCKKKRR